MKVLLRMSEKLHFDAFNALQKPHAFAAERVGFFKCRFSTSSDGLLVLAHSIHHVADEDYEDDPTAGATMGRSAIRKALQIAYKEDVGMFHVHVHEHHGRPRFSRTDFRESALFVPDFWNVQPSLPHGALVLSCDSAWGQCWYPGHASSIEMENFAVIGLPTRSTWNL